MMSDNEVDILSDSVSQFISPPKQIYLSSHFLLNKVDVSLSKKVTATRASACSDAFLTGLQLLF
jgi:hypothetical protein